MESIQKIFRKQYPIFLLFGMIFFAGTSFAEGLYPDSPPGSTMYTMEQLYDLARLRKGHIPKIEPSDTIGAPWPVPRFIDNNNGTITDRVTGLVWLKDVGCFSSGATSFFNAIAVIDLLQHGDCGLSDNSVPGDWRMPNLLELISLVDYGYSSPALPNKTGNGQSANDDPFIGVAANGSYWTGTRYKGPSPSYFYLNIGDGNYHQTIMTSSMLFWPVRGGH